MALTKKTKDDKCWHEYGKEGILVHCWWEYKWTQPLWKTVWRFLKKLTVEPPHDPAIPLLGTDAKKMKLLPQRSICSLLLISALFTIA